MTIPNEQKYKCPESPDLLVKPYFREKATESGDLYFIQEECSQNLNNRVCKGSCNYPFLFDWQHEILSSVCAELGLSEWSETQREDDGTHLTIRTTVTKGFYLTEERTVAVWHRALPESVLPHELTEMKNSRIPIEHQYKGEEFFLVRVNKNVIAFKIEYYSLIESLIRALNWYLHTPMDDMGIDLKNQTLTINANWVWIAIRGLMGSGYEEQERATLSEKLAKSHPFFEFKAPIQINWDLLKKPQDDTFQELCRVLLERDTSIKNVISIGKTRAADRGRDLEVEEMVEGFVSSKTTKWLVQCKFSTKSISPNTISGWTDRVREHKYDGYWLMTNNDITPDLFDQMKDVEKNTGIKTRVWQRGDFHTKINVYAELLKNGEFFLHVTNLTPD